MDTMHAELIAIGSELLLGEIVDTNSAHLARALRNLGVEVRWMSAVGDDQERIAALVRQALGRSPIVVTTGGLGPTVDDPTRQAVALACGRALEYRPELWAQIEARFARFGRTPGENNRRQAHIPAGAIPLENPVGTAPCFIVEQAEACLIALPGVPREMEHMFAEAAAPYLRRRFNLTAVIRTRTLRTVGMGESMVDERIGDLEQRTNPVVGLAAHAGQTDVRITAWAATEAEADAMLAETAAEVRRRLGEFVYGEGAQDVEEVVCWLLGQRGLTVAAVEAGTAGQLSGRLAAAPGAEQVFRGGAVLPLERATADPSEAAQQARREHNADIGVSACLTRQGSSALAEIAIAGEGGVEQRSLKYGGPPAMTAAWAATAALNLLRMVLLRQGKEAGK